MDKEELQQLRPKIAAFMESTVSGSKVIPAISASASAAFLSFSVQVGERNISVSESMAVLSRRSLLEMDNKKIIMVDHNEKSQAVDGIEEAEILEIIDHQLMKSS